MPYMGMDPPEAPCNQDDFMKYGTITGWNHISNNVEQIKAALQYGPVCTAIDASADSRPTAAAATTCPATDQSPGADRGLR